MRGNQSMRPIYLLPLVGSLMLLANETSQAENSYRLQPIARLGEMIGDVRIKAGGHFEIGALNDSGQIVFITSSADAGRLLIQFADGKLIPIVSAGKVAPGGKWSKTVNILSPVSMNRLGNIVFAAEVTVEDKTSLGTFLWDYQSQRVTAVALKGMPAVNNLTFELGGGLTPVINNRDEIALVAQVKNVVGQARSAVFFLGQDGKLLPVALPDQELPDGGTVVNAFLPSLDETGRITFFARRSGHPGDTPYIWEKGAIAPLPLAGLDLPPGKKFEGVTALRVNNKTRAVLLVVHLYDSAGDYDALYYHADSKLTPVVVPGQAMPGGGTFKALQFGPGEGFIRRVAFANGISFANEAGQHAFLARLQDDTTAAYRLDPDGQLSLILKSGTTTDLGTITNVGGAGSSFGIGLNSRGQVATTVRVNDGADTIVLLIPTLP
jgi:hypothetical protein